MAQLRQDYERFVERGAEVVVVGPDSPAAFRNYWARHDLPFVGLSDPARSVLKRYGQQIKLFKFGRMPAQVIIDRDGMARYIHYGNDMSDIPPNAEILDLLDGLNA